MQSLVKGILVKLAQLFKMDVSEHAMDSLVQFMMFSIIGASNTIISYVINILVLVSLRPLSLGWDYIAGNVVSFLLSVLWSFYWNDRVVFTQREGRHRSLWKALLKAYAAYGFTGIILNNILSWLWISAFHISKYVAPLINLVISVPLNFVLNKMWTFKEEKK